MSKIIIHPYTMPSRLPKRAQVGSLGRTLPARRAAVGAALPGNGSIMTGGCDIKAPPWYQPNQACGQGCNAVFSATATVVGQATGAVTFNPANSNFQNFKPIRMLATAVEDNVAPAALGSLERWMRITSILFANTELLAGGDVPLEVFDPAADQGLYIVQLPELIVAGQQLVITVGSDADNMTTARVRIALIGWAQRFVL
jgi:hypothetical protein